MRANISILRGVSIIAFDGYWVSLIEPLKH